MTRRQRHSAPVRQTRTRTRQRGAALVTDPAENTQLLSDQLKALGLYAAPTLGDGNCLFRALSDQLYGSPSQHLKLREEICDWMEAHKQRYAPFVDDDRGLDVHLRCMRQPGTYGGHLELTAFAHLKHRDVKVIQPGLVYVIEWTSGADLSPTMSTAPTLSPPGPDSSSRGDRESRKNCRDKKKSRQMVVDDDSDDSNESSSYNGAVYVAYHDWEHFSSVRNLSGPHSGLPYVVERPGNQQCKDYGTSKSKRKSKPMKQTDSSSSDDEEEEDEIEENLSDLSQIPLPLSRSASPAPSSETSSSASLSVPPVPGYNATSSEGNGSAASNVAYRLNRSPKRSFDESSGGSTHNVADGNQSDAKRTRSYARRHEGTDVDLEADTPSLMASGSSTESSSPASSPAPTPPPSMVVIPPTPVLESKPLTRRQRKALGLPKPRSSLGPQTRASAGKIIVPGGRFKKPNSTKVKETDNDGNDSANAEWEQNGSGRMDCRGFKELRI